MTPYRVYYVHTIIECDCIYTVTSPSMQPEGSPLLIMLEDVMTMDRNALAHTLVRFYLAHGSVLPFLDTLTTREIHLTCECWAGFWVELLCCHDD